MRAGVPGAVEIGVDVDKLTDAVKRAKEVVRFSYDGARNRLELGFNGERRTMAPVDTSRMAEPRMPKLNLPAVLDLPADALMDALKGCETVSDHVAFTLDNRGDDERPRFVVRAEGDVDLQTLRGVTDDESQAFCAGLGLPYFPASAKTGVNVEAAFKRLMQECLRAVSGRKTEV